MLPPRFRKDAVKSYPPTARHPEIVWWLNTIASVIYGSLGVAVGVFLIWGPKSWHQGPSMRLVAGLGLAWDFWGTAFIAYGAMLLPRPTRIPGYFLGFGLYAYFALSLFRLAVAGHLGSIVLLGGLLGFAVSQAAAGVRAMILADER